MKYKIHYQYRVYEGCEKATQLSKKWELFRSTVSWLVWLFVSSGCILGAWILSRIIKEEYEVAIFWKFLVFVITFIIGYLYVRHSKSVYPMCDELYLISQKTKENSTWIENKIIEIKNRKEKETKRATIKFLLIYLFILTLYVIFFYTG